MYLVPVSRNIRAFDRLFDDGFERFFGSNGEAARAPALDVVETDQDYTVTVDMPGASKEDIKVSIDGRRVDIAAEVKRESEAKDGQRVMHRERAVTNWSRSFTLPAELDQSQSSAKVDHGVLTLVLGKKRAPGAAQITVN